MSTIELGADTKIAKVRTALYNEYMLTQIQLIDSAGNMIASEGNVHRESKLRWQEATIPENETLVGFKVLNVGHPLNGLALVTTKNC